MANFDNVRQMVVHEMKYCTNKLLLNGFESLEVDNIVDSKISKDQKRQYLVCFKSWLPEEHLNNYRELIEEYWRKREDDEKKWKGSQDGESDKENNFISPTSSSTTTKTKRSFVFPSSHTQASPEAQPPTETDKTKFSAHHQLQKENATNSIDLNQLPLDITENSNSSNNGLRNGEEEQKTNFQLNIDEHNDDERSIFDQHSEEHFDARFMNSSSVTSSRRSPQSDGLPFTSDPVNYDSALPVVYHTETDEVDENSIDYMVKPSSQSSNCASTPPSEHRHASAYHLSDSGIDCGDVRSKVDDIPIVEPLCEANLPGYDVKRDAKMVNGDRHVSEFDDDVPRCEEDGRLSLYSDEPIEEEQRNRDRPLDEFDDRSIDEDGDDSDLSEFGRQSDGPYRGRNDPNRASSDCSDTTPEQNLKLNRFTPLNTVQVSSNDKARMVPQEAHFEAQNEIENDYPDHRSTPTSTYEESSPRTTSSGIDSTNDLSNLGDQAKITYERPAKKRKTLDDIVRKISSANEQQAAEKIDIKNENPWKNGDEPTYIKKEVAENMDVPEHAQTEMGKQSPVNTDGNRENNVYWSAGKSFQKRNISYKCKYCEHRFDDENLLKDHERSHGQHVCRNCNESFMTSAALFEHREVAHAFKPRQRYNKCRFCPTLYADPVMLQRHEEIHHLSKSPVTPGHEGEAGKDLPPPLMTIDESHQRKFPRYENHRDGGRGGEHPYRPRSPRDVKPGRNDPNTYDRRGAPPGEDEEAKSIVRNPIRNLLGKMYQTQKKMEHVGSNGNGNGEQHYPPPPHRQTGYRSKMTPPTSHPYHYSDYPPPPTQQRCYSSGPQSRSPEHPQQREMREYRPAEVRPVSTPHGDEEGKQFHDVVHVCRICNKSFGVKERLEQHWLSAHPEAPTCRCEVCHEIFLDKEDLDSHMAVHLKQDFYCGYCRKAFDCRASYETHMRGHSNDRPFTCHICGRGFSLRTNLRRHILIHTDITPYRCHVCFKGFRRSDMLSSHIKQYHANDEKCRNFDPSDPAFRNDRHDGTTNGGSASPVYQPASGGNSPRTPQHENNNINGHDGYRSPNQHSDEPKVYPIEPRIIKQSPDSLPIKHSPTSPRMHHSPIVSRHHEGGDMAVVNHSMVSIGHLPNVVGMHQVSNDQHYHRPPPNGIIPPPMGSERPPTHQLVAPIPVMKQQSRYSPYKTNLVNILPLPVTSSRMECNECGEKFTSESLYEIHMQSHVKEASYTCRKCRRTFSGKSQYNSHMQTHENNKSHSCPYCHRSFSMKGNLRRHIRIHTNEAPYECPICFQRFRRSDGLKGHIKRHDAMGESAPGDMVPSQAST